MKKYTKTQLSKLTKSELITMVMKQQEPVINPVARAKKIKRGLGNKLKAFGEVLTS